ncbi:hypothetical protein HYH03_010104 [Edaphochlamys debaryana]|uniref:Armadillo-like repeats domain-containing protein n=1 Tax=Edaphochlamys debaryana TaxID=47281 RepID=A0A836BX06_9CHLO|nr:hypothetical protein HYH03_010104 [Edaphochlamys debaryana]|eukprot:KAG2491532.1 hypothetical protein HYH03_010104 [Edaphochlamys debaryana]
MQVAQRTLAGPVPQAISCPALPRAARPSATLDLAPQRLAALSAAPLLPPRPAPSRAPQQLQRPCRGLAPQAVRRPVPVVSTEEETEETEEETETEQVQAQAPAASTSAAPSAAAPAVAALPARAAHGPAPEAAAAVLAAAPAAAAPAAAAVTALPAETVAEVEAAPQPQMVTEEFEMEVEQVIEPLTFQSALTRSRNFVSNTWQGEAPHEGRVGDSRGQGRCCWARGGGGNFVSNTWQGKLLLGGIAAVALGTLGLAAYRVWERANTAKAKRLRQIDRNRDLIEGLNKHLMAAGGGNRAGLTASECKRLTRASGFTPVEVFRKYLWYLLRERRFDQGAVDDLVALKEGLALTDADVGEALRERSQRIYEKYGTLMLNTEGLTLQGAQRKASCTALFRKVLYLAEAPRLVGSAASEPGGAGLESVADIGKIFGATIEDMEKLRIRNLYEAELDLEGMVDTDDEAAPGAGGDKKPQA